MYHLITLAGQDVFTHMARTFMQLHEDKLNDNNDAPDDLLRLKLVRLNDRGLMLRRFQQHVKELVDAYHVILDDDELIEALVAIDNNEIAHSKWVGDDEIIETGDLSITELLPLIDWIKGFENDETWCMVLAVVPVDMNGTVAVIVKSREHDTV